MRIKIKQKQKHLKCCTASSLQQKRSKRILFRITVVSCCHGAEMGWLIATGTTVLGKWRVVISNSMQKWWFEEVLGCVNCICQPGSSPIEVAEWTKERSCVALPSISNTLFVMGHWTNQMKQRSLKRGVLKAKCHLWRRNWKHPVVSCRRPGDAETATTTQEKCKVVSKPGNLQGTTTRFLDLSATWLQLSGIKNRLKLCNCSAWNWRAWTPQSSPTAVLPQGRLQINLRSRPHEDHVSEEWHIWPPVWQDLEDIWPEGCTESQAKRPMVREMAHAWPDISSKPTRQTSEEQKKRSKNINESKVLMREDVIGEIQLLFPLCNVCDVPSQVLFKTVVAFTWKNNKNAFFTDWLICNFRECHPIIIVQRIRVTSCFCQLPRPTDLWAFDQQDSTEMRVCVFIMFDWHQNICILVSCFQDSQGYGHVIFRCPRKCAHPILISQQCVGSHPATEGYFRSLYIFHCIWVKPIPRLLWVNDQHQNGAKMEMSWNVLNWAFNSSVRSPYTAGPMISVWASQVLDREFDAEDALGAPHQQLFVALEGLLLWQCHVETLIKGPVYFRKSKAKRNKTRK